MDNKEIGIKFDEVQKRIEELKAKNLDVTDLLKEKYELLKIAYARIVRETSDEKFDKNPNKYSTLLSYIGTMKKTAEEAGMPLTEVEAMESDVKTQMGKNNLAWLLNE